MGLFPIIVFMLMFIHNVQNLSAGDGDWFVTRHPSEAWFNMDPSFILLLFNMDPSFILLLFNMLMPAN
jgi:hypothetical protein